MNNDDYDYLVESCLEIANRDDDDNDVLSELTKDIETLLNDIQ